MTIDTSGWTGEGSFTQVLMDALKEVGAIEFLKLEDAPASRADAGYAFISNEIYVRFATVTVEIPVRRFGFIPGVRRAARPAMTLGELASTLTDAAGVGAPDYADEGMLQYLRAERVTAPYQTKGVKVVEMARIYDAGAPPAAEHR